MSSGGSGTYGPQNMNDGIERNCNAFSWISNDTTTTNGSWIQLNWPTAQTVGSIALDVEPAWPMCATGIGRNLASATVQWWNGGWVTNGTISGQTGEMVYYSFSAPVSTIAIRLVNVATSNVTNGQNTNTVVHEWHVYGSGSCAPP
jgi:hypothetical protein